MENLYSYIAESVRRNAGAIALESESGERYTYAQFDDWTAKYAAWLATAGVGVGDRVLVQADKSAHLLMLCFACIRAGAIFVPISAACRQSEVLEYLSDAGPAAVICDPRRAGVYYEHQAAAGASYRIFTLNRQERGSARDGATNTSPMSSVAVVSDDAPAALMYTSGTTGRPKAAIITHRNLYANGCALRDFWNWSASDVLLHSLPLYHLHGLFVATLPSLLKGSTILLHRRFHAGAIIGALQRASVFMGIPTYFSRLLASTALTRERCRNIRLFISGSAPLRRRAFEEFHQRTGHDILQRYGMTETGGVACTPPEMERKAGSIGVPLPGFTLRITDARGEQAPVGMTGELQVRGESVFAGYWRRPTETAEAFTSDGYFRTGDLAQRTPDGYYEIVGRAKDIIISNGENVNPLEVEAALDCCPGVAESAVVGISDGESGEVVMAVIVPNAGAITGDISTLTNNLQECLKYKLAYFKRPQRIIVRDSLPRNAMGKVQKNLLRDDPELQACVAEKAAP